MFNPLLQDLSKIKTEELDTKITDLMQKYFIAARSGQGGGGEEGGGYVV